MLNIQREVNLTNLLVRSSI